MVEQQETREGDGLSYEQARDELAGVVRDLEKGGLTLEESLALWERGQKLATICEQWLEGARARLAAELATDEDGPQPATEPTADDTPF